MSRVIAFQACRHGIGCSHLVANVAVTLMQRGYRVGILDQDPDKEGVKTLLGLKLEEIPPMGDGVWCCIANLPPQSTLLCEFKPDRAITALDTPTVYLPATGSQWLPAGNQLDGLKTAFGEGKLYEGVLCKV